MLRRTTRSTRAYTLLPYSTLFRSTDETVRLLGLSGPGKRARAHPAAQVEIGYGDPLVETFVGADLQVNAIMPVEMDDLREVRPQEGSVREYATANDRVAAIASFADQSLGDRRRIVLEVDEFATRNASVIVMDQLNVAEDRKGGGLGKSG